MRIFMTALLMTLAACGGGEAPPAPEAPEQPVAEAPAEAPEAAMPEKVVRAAELAAAVKADPSNAAAALEAKGSSVEEFEGLLFEIASDAELSKAWAKATAS